MTEIRSVASMFPPERRIATGPSPGTLPARSAATPTAPAPSTTSFARSSRRTIAVEISSSETDTSALSVASRIDIVNSPGALTAIPSAIVKPLPPGRQLAAWTPTTSTSGRTACSASEIPEQRPPPPMGTTTVATSGSWSASSSPSVPCPAITASSSKGWTKSAPASSTLATAAFGESSNRAPVISTRAPCLRVPPTLPIGPSGGRKTAAGPRTSRGVQRAAQLGVALHRALEVGLRPRRGDGEHLAREVPPPPLLEAALVCEVRPVLLDPRPQVGHVVLPHRLGEDDRRTPRALAVEGEDRAHLVHHRLRRGVVHLVHGDHVRNLHDPRLQGLDRVA